MGNHTRCNVWILDGDLYHKGLLKFAVSAESLQDTIVVFVADMSRPWTVMESLQKWASVLQEHIDKMKIPPEEMRDMEQKFIKEFQEYVEPEEGYQGSPQRRGPSSGQEDEHVSLPLGENVLTHNLGIPVLVVCTKLVHDKELAAEDEQVFLMKQQSFLAKQPATPTRASESPARGPAGSPRTQGRAGPANVPSASPITSVKKPDPNIKRQKTVLTNVQEELDRMTRKPDSMVTTNSPPTENEA
ncbi:hypothetical protein llap_16625 [Limosa lapponica baueri]|uniref:Dynein light intermediate chain n=1 Tax=Limosa lapponica baueri TaxID=1758121 RepID=A0A2I0TGZ3_LIMLA|nr:hypothetical protein llap_16625 [Limosa lapponica baueri]